VHVEDDRWPRKKSVIPLTANKTVNAGVAFVMQFAAMNEMAITGIAVA
jgi:hypothetical protein